MSTRSFTGAITEAGVVGVYVHSDGYPESRLPHLKQMIERDGATKVAATILSEGQYGGWSYLFTDYEENTLGPDRAEVIPGYGLAYRDGKQEKPFSLDTIIDDIWFEHAYVIDTETGEVKHFDLTTDEGRLNARAFAADHTKTTA